MQPVTKIRPKKTPWAEWFIDTDLGKYFPTIHVYDSYSIKDQLYNLGFVFSRKTKSWKWMGDTYSMYEAEIFTDAMLDRLRGMGVTV